MLVLFLRKDKDKPTRELNQDSPETIGILDKHRGNSEQQDSVNETLDDIGIPPPPPLSLQRGNLSGKQNSSSKKLSLKKRDMLGTVKHTDNSDVVSEFSETRETPKLKPFLSDVHETSEGELPDDYDEHVQELEDMHIIDTSKKAAVITSYGSQTSERRSKNVSQHIKKVIIPKKDLKKLHDSTKKIIEKLEQDTNKQLHVFEKKFKETLRKNAEISRTNIALSQSNNSLVKENKALFAENKKIIDEHAQLHDAYMKTLANQRKNTAFVENLKKYFNPLNRQEQKILSDNAVLVKRSKEIMKQFTALVEVTKSVDVRNQSLGTEMDGIKEDHAILREKHSTEIDFLKKSVGRIDALEDDITRVRAMARDTEHAINRLESRHLHTTVERLQKEVKDLHQDDVDIEKIVKKLEEKVSILRDKVHLHKKK